MARSTSDVIDKPPAEDDVPVSDDQTSEEPASADGSDSPPAEAPTDAPTGAPRHRSRWGAVALAVVGVVVLVVGGLSWQRAAHDDGLAAAKTRDQALIAASSEIATLNSLDYRDVDGGLRTWLAATTGTLHDQLSKATDKDKQLLAQQQKTTTGKVLEAAVTDLDAKRGTATVIAAVEITVRGTTGEPSIKRNRYTANLVRVDGRWLLDTLSQLPVDVS